MNISELFIRRPVATILLSVALTLGRSLRLPGPAGRGAADGRLSDGLGLGPARRRLPRDHGDVGRDAADQAVLDDPGDPDDQRHELPGLHLDHDRVRAQPRHRPGRGRRAGGDRAHAAAPAGRDDDAAELPQAQPGRRADPAARAAERHRAAVEARRLRADGDLADPVDDQRRRPGADLRQPEIRRARPARSERARGARHRHRRDPDRDRGRQRQHAGRHGRGQRPEPDHPGEHAAAQRRRLPRHHRGGAQRQPGAPRRGRDASSTRSRTPRSRAGTTASARSCSPCSASPTPTPSRSSTGQGDAAEVPGGARADRAASTSC